MRPCKSRWSKKTGSWARDLEIDVPGKETEYRELYIVNRNRDIRSETRANINLPCKELLKIRNVSPYPRDWGPWW